MDNGISVQEAVDLLTRLASYLPHYAGRYQSFLNETIIPDVAKRPSDQLINSEFFESKVTNEFNFLSDLKNWGEVIESANEALADYISSQDKNNPLANQVVAKIRIWMNYKRIPETGKDTSSPHGR